MGFFNKLMFWKKEDNEIDFEHLTQKEMSGDHLKEIDLEKGSSFNKDLTSDPLNTEPNSFNPERMPTTDLIQEETKFEEKGSITKRKNPDLREHELINSKLDTIKALLNSLDQRIANIEKVTGVEEKKPKNLW